MESRVRAKRQMLWWATLLSMLVGAGIWMLWVLPVASSVAQAQPAAIGRTVSLPAGGPSGVWASGPAALLGLVDCTAETADGRALAVGSVASPGWDDVLWWMTPRGGFAPVRTVQGAGDEAASLTCTTLLDQYDGAFLVAADTTGGAVGLGRGGNVDFPAGTLLALGAVMLPLFGVSLFVVLAVQALRRSKHRARGLSVNPLG